MYVKYCENKPKSEYIVAEYIDYFEVGGSPNNASNVITDPLTMPPMLLQIH